MEGTWVILDFKKMQYKYGLFPQGILCLMHCLFRFDGEGVFCRYLVPFRKLKTAEDGTSRQEKKNPRREILVLTDFLTKLNPQRGVRRICAINERQAKI